LTPEIEKNDTSIPELFILLLPGLGRHTCLSGPKQGLHTCRMNRLTVMTPDYNEILWLVAKLMQQYGYFRVYIDGANPSFIKSLKRMIGEDEHYEKYTKEQMERYARNVHSMKVYPVNFSTRHKEMLGHTKLLLEKGYVAINPKFYKLVTSLSTAVDNEGSLDKQLTSYSDIFDAFRLSLQNYFFSEEK
jgi:hypothetical protein